MSSQFYIIGLEPIGPEFYTYLQHALYPDIEPSELHYSELVNVNFIRSVFVECVYQALDVPGNGAEFHINLLCSPDFSRFQGLFDDKTTLQREAFANSFRRFALELAAIVKNSQLHPEWANGSPIRVEPTWLILKTESDQGV